MLQSDRLSVFEWRQLVERLDRAVAEAARGYMKQLQARHIPLTPAAWAQELDELARGREPDFRTPGLPLVYALKYMPRRVISVLGSLLTLASDRYPTNVLDMGSGTGAAALHWIY